MRRPRICLRMCVFPCSCICIVRAWRCVLVCLQARVRAASLFCARARAQCVSACVRACVCACVCEYVCVCVCVPTCWLQQAPVRCCHGRHEREIERRSNYSCAQPLDPWQYRSNRQYLLHLRRRAGRVQRFTVRANCCVWISLDTNIARRKTWRSKHPDEATRK